MNDQEQRIIRNPDEAPIKSSSPVLLAEDEEHDVFLLQRAFRIAEVANPLVPVPDGREAINYLAGAGTYADRDKHPKPCLLLLDLKLPLVSGFEVLEWLRSRSTPGKILPAIVLTSSDRESDLRKALDLGAHDYLVKPMDFDALLALVRQLKKDWLEPLIHGQSPRKKQHS